MESALAFLLAALGQERPAPDVVAIEHVAVVPMDREVVLADRTLLVRDGRIVELGPAAEVTVPEGALRIDGAGRFVMPGLADMHVHCWDENDLYLFVANGVTVVRNLFGAPLHLGWRERIEAGELVGPRIYTAGALIDGTPPVWPGSTLLTDPDDAERIVREQKEAGYDFLKPYAMLTEECYEALAVAAETQGMWLMGHVPEAVDVRAVLEAGQRTIEHLGGFARAAQAEGSPFGRAVDFRTENLAWQHVDAPRLAVLAREMREAGAWNCPTLVVFQKWSKGPEAEALLARDEMRFVSPGIKAFWAPDARGNYLATMPDAGIAAAHAALPGRRAAVAALRDAGAGILLGTDMGNPYVVAGFALHEELANLVEAGLTPYQALRAGTAEAARCLDAQDDWGTIAVGRRADLVVLEANPLADVGNARRRVGVLLAGRWLPEEELRAELEARAARFASAAGPR